MDPDGHNTFLACCLVRDDVDPQSTHGLQIGNQQVFLAVHFLRELMREISEAAWRCADPGVQYDTTINQWHTSPNSGRINASNPCSEYMHVDDSACNLASLNLMKFRREDGELDVEALASGVGMSAGHLSREFRRAYGEPPYSYLMTRRIERAMALLRRGDLSVTEVCFAVGCSSLGTFSTRFTELVGMSPGAYRREAAGATVIYRTLDVRDADAVTAKETQFYSMLGTRAIWHKGWKASAVSLRTAPVPNLDVVPSTGLPSRR